MYGFCYISLKTIVLQYPMVAEEYISIILNQDLFAWLNILTFSLFYV